MKKLWLSLVAIVSLASVAHAQLYLKAGLGINRSIAADVVGFNSSNTEDEVVKGSFGAGLVPGIGIGYMFNEHVGAELGIGYLLGNKYEGVWTGQGGSDTYTMKARALQIAPAIVFKAGNQDSKWRPYTRFGLLIGVAAKAHEDYVSVSGADREEMHTVYTVNNYLGYTGALGISFRLNKMLELYVEAAGQGASAWLKSAEVTEATVNGVDVLGDMDPTDKKWDYSEKVNSSNPNDQLTSSLPMSNLGVQIGVHINL